MTSWELIERASREGHGSYQRACECRNVDCLMFALITALRKAENESTSFWRDVTALKHVVGMAVTNW